MKPKTRMFIAETDHLGIITDRMLQVDNPEHIPRIGEFVESEEAMGWVKKIKWDYSNPDALIVYVFLETPEQRIKGSS
jgi:hypothetical protein